jgi:putative cardiolipin synthase
MRILTNSLRATDVPRCTRLLEYREALLRGGVRLYELKPSATGREADGARAARPSEARERACTRRRSVDRNRIFIGSFNFDPRSARPQHRDGHSRRERTRLRCSCPKRSTATFRSSRTRWSSPMGRLQWIERTAAGELRHDSRAWCGALKRLWVDFLSILPIEWLL